MTLRFPTLLSPQARYYSNQSLFWGPRLTLLMIVEAEHMLLLAIIEVRGYHMDYEAVAERVSILPSGARAVINT